MHWVTKVQEYPKGGDVRHTRRFAWRRTQVGRFTVWLEFYWVTESFFQPAGGGPGWWSEMEKSLCHHT